MTGRRVAVSTQEKNPRSAVIRTVLVAVFALFPLLNCALLVIMDELQPYVGSLPAWVFPALNGALVAVTVLIGICTRVLAIPGVNAWLRRYAKWLAPEDKAQTPTDPALTDEYHVASRDGLTTYDGGKITVHPSVDGYFSTPIDVAGDTSLDPDK